MTALLEISDLHAFYGGAHILEGVNLVVEAGETVGLVGRNGAGKTTTLLSIFGVPTVRGQVIVDGVPRDRRTYRAASCGVSLVPQGRRIFSNLTVEENIILGQASGRSGQWTLKSIYELFPNLARAAKRRGTALSGGEQQMLAIARALMAGPKLLLLDEPTEGLAPVVIDELVKVLRLIQEQGTALLLVEQHVRMVQALAQRFVALRQGQVVSEGPVSAIQDRAVQELIAM
jgi:ABC-type branched-subunit amino acid transport system ATPase component